MKSPKADHNPQSSRGIKSYGKRYTARHTYKHLFRDRIHDAVKEETDAPSGSPEWLKHYALAQATIFNSLDEDELEECSELAEKWNEEGPSAEKQQQ